MKDPKEGKGNKQIQMYEVSLAENPYSIEALDQIPKLKNSVEKYSKMLGLVMQKINYGLEEKQLHYMIQSKLQSVMKRLLFQ